MAGSSNGRRLKIGVDIDGVLADIVATMLPLLARECGRPVSAEDITSYGFSEALGIPEHRTRAVLDELLVGGQYRSAPPIIGAVAGMSALGDHDLWLVTSRPEEVREATADWLALHAISYRQLVFAPAQRKAYRADHFDLFVEDNFDTALALCAEGITVLLFDQPWNRSGELPLGIRRVSAWPDIIDSVARFACALRS